MKTRVMVVVERINLEGLIAQGEAAERALRLLQDRCNHPAEFKTTVMEYGWGTDTCGVCHKKQTYPASDETRAAQFM